MIYPLVSFCISTYRRPEFLKSTIEIILRQKYPNIEITISEDPSENTSEQMVKSFKSNKIIYRKNSKHMGMVKSFNKAFSLSKGDFVSIMADDDPPTAYMLEVFAKTLEEYPDMKAFWGASYADIKTKKIADVTHLHPGLNSLTSKDREYGSIEILEPQLFFKRFFKQDIFPHYLWNASLVSRDLVKEISGVPDYNSAHFSDYAYLLKIAAKTKFIIINKELAIFTLHELNYGRKKNTLEEYKRGVIGFDKTISKLANKFGCEKEYQKFLSDYVLMFLLNRLEHYEEHKYDINPKELFKIYVYLSKSLPFLKRRLMEAYLKLNFFQSYKKIDFLRKIYGDIKLELINNSK